MGMTVCAATLIILCNLLIVYGWTREVSSDNSFGPHAKTCIFPSVHRRAAIYECQHSSLSVPTENFYSRKPIWWCPLTDNFDHYPEWAHCPETASTYGGNQPGQTCHFPFVYQKQIHTTCIRNGGDLVYNQTEDPVPIDTGKSGYWWCSTTENFDRDGKWTRCRPQLAQQLPCHFPKRSVWAGGIVSGIAYECQAFAGHWVCMTELGQLRQCPSMTNLARNQRLPYTEGGNNPGRECHFPFQATLLILTKQLSWTGPVRKRNFTTCLPGTPNSPLSGVVYPPWIGYWCATTDNFDRDHLWTRCQLEPDQLPPAATASQSNSIATFPPNSESSLARVWTQLAWFQQMSVEERSKLTTRTHAFSPEFEQSLRMVESKRAQWDVSESDAQTSWWVWLAPFWWAVYEANPTPVTTTPSNQYLTESTTESATLHNSNPLSLGFQLPSWVDSWSSAGWLEFGLGMNVRWQKLIASVHLRWHKAWLIAYFTGFASAVGIMFGLILLILLCLDETRRKELLNTICGRQKLKRPLSNLPPSIDESNYAVCTPLNGITPPKYPCEPAEDYCPRSRPHSQSIEPEANKGNAYGKQGENYIMNDGTMWCTLNHNTEIYPPKRCSPRPLRTGHSTHSSDQTYESVHTKPECFGRPDLPNTCPCWPVRDQLNCLRHQQQLNHALELIVNLIRTNENLDELFKSAELRAQFQHLLSDRSSSSTHDSMCSSQLPILRPKISGCTDGCHASLGNLCNTNRHHHHANIIDDQIIPSAPPPSYEQLTD